MWEACRVSIAQVRSCAAGADIPAFRSDRIVFRERLADALDAAFEGPTAVHVALACAPAGSGKTTLLSGWARRARSDGGQPITAWATVDDHDNDSHVLHDTLVAALVNAGDPELRRICRGLPPPSPAQRFPIGEALRQFADPIRLVIDDAHLLHDPDALADLESFLRAPPARLRIVIAGRFEPPLAVQRLRLDGKVFDLDFRDLAFTADEAAELLTEHDVHLPDTDLAALMKRTEGWAAGLRLAGMSLAGHPDPAGLIANFTGDRRAVADYLFEQVLEGLEPREREFLLYTSVPATFTVALAEQLTGYTDAHDITDRLEHQNCLLSRIEESPTVFRYHPLLRSYLRAETTRLGAKAVAQLEQATAQWYTEFGDALLSLEHGINAGDHDHVVGVLSESGLTLVQNGHGETVQRLLARASRSVRDHPAARLADAAAALAIGNTPAAESTLAALEPSWPPLDGTADRQRLLHESLRVQAAIRTGDLTPALARLSLVDAGTTGDPELDAFVLLQLGRGRLYQGDAAGAEGPLRRALAHARAGRSPRTVLHALAALAAASVCRGRVSEAAEFADEAVELGRDAELTHDVETHLAVLLGAWCRWIRLEDATESAGTATVALVDLDTDLARAASSLAALFGLATSQDRHGSVAAIHAGGGSSRHRPPPGIAAAVLPSIHSAYLLGGESQWANECVARSAVALPGTGDAVVIDALAHLHDQHFERARKLLVPVLDGNLMCIAATNLITAWLAEAVAAHRRGHRARTHSSLAEALRLAEPESVLRPFHDVDPSIRDLLLNSQGRFGHLGGFADRVVASLPARESGPTEALTPRELELLGELPSWRTAEQIANDLCVSVNTVKTHLRGIYRKLGVTTRRDAVAAAHTRGLL
ncbi:LuxR family transcriptional regulator [Rhodococcus sp. W8901]|nr:LuxR family transcriptional regulator [Rhodococcus sp. W8901]